MTGEIDRLTAAVIAGGALEGLVGALKTRERERERLRSDRQQLEHLNLESVDGTTMALQLPAIAKDWRAAMGRNVTQARQILRKLLVGRFIIAPRENRTCDLSGRASYDKLLVEVRLQRRWRP